jgi:hypothetical protein
MTKNFENLNFGFVSSFDIRISNFRVNAVGLKYF